MISSVLEWKIRIMEVVTDSLSDILIHSDLRDANQRNT